MHRMKHLGLINRLLALAWTLTGLYAALKFAEQTDLMGQCLCLGYSLTCLFGTWFLFRLTALADRAIRGEISREVTDSPHTWTVPERWPSSLMVDNALVELTMLERARQMAERQRNQMP